MSDRTIDLNIFYREDWDPEIGTYWSDTLTIDPYIYETDGYGTRKYETSLLIECTPEETAEIAKHYPEHEYGSDWWDFLDNFENIGPASIVELIKTINLQDPSMDMVTATEPTWWVTKNEDMLF
jgi:hypothetical protein